MSVIQDEFIQKQRAVWASGDWPSVAELVRPVSEELADEAEIGEGTRVLDVAGGTGSLSIHAAKKGASVVCSDLVSEHFKAGREHAAEAGVEVEWAEANAEELPFEDNSFDRVLSVFGVMFAPRHAKAAGELLRIVHPDGLIGVSSWIPEGTNGKMFATIGSFMPPPPDFASPPPLWGTEEHVRELLGDSCELDFERRSIRFGHESLEEYADWFCSSFGPLVAAKSVLGDERFAELKQALTEVWREGNLADDGSFAMEPTYLRVLARPR
jgi:ubiquinone/menaquinone biosynthesis C-methylase UbiE